MTIVMMMMTMIIIAMINNNNNDKFSTYRISPLFLAVNCVLQCLDTFLASLVTIGCHGYDI